MSYPIGFARKSTLIYNLVSKKWITIQASGKTRCAMQSKSNQSGYFTFILPANLLDC